MAEHINVMLSEEEINSRIAELGEQISRDYEGKEIFLICILKGASFFACELAKRITVPVNIDFMKVSSYGGGTVSSGQVSIKMDVSESIAGKDVLIRIHSFLFLFVLCHHPHLFFNILSQRISFFHRSDVNNHSR